MKAKKPDYFALAMSVLWLACGMAMAFFMPHAVVGYGLLSGLRLSKFLDSIGGK